MIGAGTTTVTTTTTTRPERRPEHRAAAQDPAHPRRLASTRPRRCCYASSNGELAFGLLNDDSAGRPVPGRHRPRTSSADPATLIPEGPRMPILVEPDTTTAGVLTSALPGGAQVVARARRGGRLAQRARRVRRRDRAHARPDRWRSGLAERVRVGPPGDHRRADPATSWSPRSTPRPCSAGIGAVVAADDHAGSRHRRHPRAQHLGGHPRPDRSGRGRARRPGVHGVLPQGRGRQDHDGGQPGRRARAHRRRGLRRRPRPRLR